MWTVMPFSTSSFPGLYLVLKSTMSIWPFDGHPGGGLLSSMTHGASVGSSQYSLILSTDTMLVSMSDVIRTSQLSIAAD